jgi:hypothetical protein
MLIGLARRTMIRVWGWLMPVWNGRVKQCIWSYTHGKLTTPEWEAFVVATREDLTAAPPATTMLTVTCDVTPPNANERKLLADLLRSGAADRIIAHAFVTDSRIVQGVLTALEWLAKKPYKESVFTDVREATRWLATFAPELSVTEIVLAIHASVPEPALLPALRAPPSGTHG